MNFYSYLYTHFNTGEVSAKTETKSENKSDGQNLYDDIKKNSDSKASDDAKNAEKGNITNSKDLSSLVTKGWPSKDAGNNDEIPSSEIKTGDSAAKDTSKSLSSMFKNLGDAAAKWEQTCEINCMFPIMSSVCSVTIQLRRKRKKVGQRCRDTDINAYPDEHNKQLRLRQRG